MIKCTSTVIFCTSFSKSFWRTCGLRICLRYHFHGSLNIFKEKKEDIIQLGQNLSFVFLYLFNIFFRNDFISKSLIELLPNQHSFSISLLHSGLDIYSINSSVGSNPSYSVTFLSCDRSSFWDPQTSISTSSPRSICETEFYLLRFMTWNLKIFRICTYD